MPKTHKLKHVFVESFPDVMEDGTLYISVQYCSAGHKCCCGCGREVVTPLSPTDWSLTFDGDSITLHPSVGNWNFPCRSHYWIRKNRVKWAGDWNEDEIAAGRLFDSRAKKRYYAGGTPGAAPGVGPAPATGVLNLGKRPGFWEVVRRIVSGQ